MLHCGAVKLAPLNINLNIKRLHIAILLMFFFLHHLQFCRHGVYIHGIVLVIQTIAESRRKKKMKYAKKEVSLVIIRVRYSYCMHMEVWVFPIKLCWSQGDLP